MFNWTTSKFLVCLQFFTSARLDKRTGNINTTNITLFVSKGSQSSMCRSNRAAKVPGVFRAYGKSIWLFRYKKVLYTKNDPQDLSQRFEIYSNRLLRFRLVQRFVMSVHKRKGRHRTLFFCLDYTELYLNIFRSQVFFFLINTIFRAVVKYNPKWRPVGPICRHQRGIVKRCSFLKKKNTRW